MAVEEYTLTSEDFQDNGEVLGNGASGVVYKMMYKKDKKYLAVKKISTLDEKEKDLLRIELNTLMNCKSDNTIKCYGAFFKQVLFAR